MLININGRNYSESFLNSLIEEAHKRKGEGMTTQPTLFPDKSTISYGTKVWFLIKRYEPNHYSVWVSPNTWIGSTQQFQLLEQGQCFLSFDEANNALMDIISKTSPLISVNMVA